MGGEFIGRNYQHYVSIHKWIASDWFFNHYTTPTYDTLCQQVDDEQLESPDLQEDTK